MTLTENRIIDLGYQGLNITKLSQTESTETLLVTLEGGKDFPEHTSPKDTLLIVLTGEIIFNQEDKKTRLTTFDHYCFKAHEPHSVQAQLNSKFLIIR